MRKLLPILLSSALLLSSCSYTMRNTGNYLFPNFISVSHYGRGYIRSAELAVTIGDRDGDNRTGTIAIAYELNGYFSLHVMSFEDE